MPDQQQPLRILLFEDSATSALLVRVCLEDGLGVPFVLEVADCLAAGFELLADDHYDLLIVDLTLPESIGLDTFLRVHERASLLPIVILTGIGDRELAIEAVRLGAQDYVLKDKLDSDTLSRAVHFAIERHRLQRSERELHAAHVVQSSLYPNDLLELPGFEIAGTASPAEAACGDYFDYVPMSDDAVGIAVGDVSGHGMRAALLMVEVRAYLRVLSRNTPPAPRDPGEILTEANDLLATGDTGHFISLFFACLDSAARTLTFAGAGHRAYLLRASGQVERLESTGMPLGLVHHEPIPSAEPVNLMSGDLVLMPTDGIFETQNTHDELFGEDRMLEVVAAHRDRPPREIIELLNQTARDFAGNNPQHDDMTAVVIKVMESTT